MSNREIAQLLFKVQMDDLKDADMLADYAHSMKDAGDMQLAEAMANRAKVRLNQMRDCDANIANVMARMRTEMPEAQTGEESLYSVMYKDYIATWAEKVRYKLESL